MIFNYIKIAWRYLRHHKIFSLVNLVGLTLGFTCFMVLSLYVIDELGYDSFHRDADRTYRVIQQIEEPGAPVRSVATVAPLIGTEAQAQFPEVEAQTRLIEIGRLTMGNEPLDRDYERIWVADDNFFRFFDYRLLHGNPETALLEPGSVVITESIALKYFGKTDVLGEPLYTNRFEATVTGVIEDFPPNSHLDIQTIHSHATWDTLIDGWEAWLNSNWTDNSLVTYLKLAGSADPAGVEQKITSMADPHFEDVSFQSRFELQPLTNIHLHSQGIQGGMNVNPGNPLYLYMFGIVAFLLLGIACFNYMNLSTAAATRRSREVGMRKALGAGKTQLALQYTGEALLLSLISLVMALLLVEVGLPYLNDFMNKELALPYGNLPLMSGLLGVVLLSAVLSSLYPAFILSRLQPSVALKKTIRLGGGQFSLRKVLVVAQFVISIVMISATIVIYQQLQHLNEKDLGFEVDDLLVVDINSGPLRSQFESIKQEFQSLNQVTSVTVSSRVPGEWKNFPIANVEETMGEGSGQMIFIGADENFLQTYDIELLEGRNLTNGPADSSSVLLTASAVERLGMEDPVGRTVQIPSFVWSGDLAVREEPLLVRVAGIVEDFHFQSFREELQPLMLASWRNPVHSIDYYTLQVQTSDWQGTLADLREINNRFDPENPMEHTFLENRFQQYYETEFIQGRLFLVFSGIVILIASLGLFALASFSIENRIKEIGIRKVLGARVGDIIQLLTREFALLVGVAFLVSIPITWYAAQSWLQEFAYRIDLSWWIFPAAGLIALLIALATISWQTVKTALVNPVESLRSE